MAACSSTAARSSDAVCESIGSSKQQQQEQEAAGYCIRYTVEYFILHTLDSRSGIMMIDDVLIMFHNISSSYLTSSLSRST
jgi:hypothetical protein